MNNSETTQNDDFKPTKAKLHEMENPFSDIELGHSIVHEKEFK